MWLFFDIVALVAVLKLLVELDRPFLCAVIYTGLGAFLGMLFGVDLVALVGRCLLTLAITGPWFWLLNQIELATLPWWVVLAAGTLVGFVMGVI